MPRLALACVIVIATSTAASADMYREADKLVTTIELLVPDLRVETDARFDDADLVLSWPLALRAGTLTPGDAVAIGFTHFGELQLQIAQRAVRGLLGERITFASSAEEDLWAPLVELGGIVGQDGSGGFGGIGVAWGKLRDGVMLALVVRAYLLADAPNRGDIALDLQIPLDL